MTANVDAALISDDLLQRAEQMLRLRLETAPSDHDALAAFALILRKQGRLADAATTYRRLVESDPDDAAAALAHAILSGAAVPQALAPGENHPAPFALVDEFLPQPLHQALQELSLAGRADFVASTAGEHNEYQPDHLRSVELPGAAELKDRFRERLRTMLRAVTMRLGMPPFELGGIEVKVRAYRDGDFFRLHQDAIHNRRLSFVYFFHFMPRRFDGGDLLLFDSSVDGSSLAVERFTRIVPRSNSLVIFPSHCYHLVVPVQCASDDFADSRFAVNGHVQQAVPTAVGDEGEGRT